MYIRPLALTFLLLFALFSCKEDKKPIPTTPAMDTSRPMSPWVFRSVMDTIPRMITLALQDDFFASLSTQTGRLYKVWKGNVNFDGAVYTTKHGPQPISVGNAYIIDMAMETPWSVYENGEAKSSQFQYNGHRFVNGQVELLYSLSVGENKIKIVEKVEHKFTQRGKAILNRTFTVDETPRGNEIKLDLNISSVISTDLIETNGKLEIVEESSRETDGVNTVDLKAQLTLNASGSTSISIPFTRNPVLPDPNVKKSDIKDDRPLGEILIAESDCRACHNRDVKTVGPAYMTVAEKYEDNEENRSYLFSKIKNGGSGVWGEAVMTAHPQLSDSILNEMVAYIMELDKDSEKQPAEPNKSESLDYVFGQTNVEDSKLTPGLALRINEYYSELTKIADLTKENKEVERTVVGNINFLPFDLSELGDNFSMLLDGYLKVESSKLYKFKLISDDGAQLFINDSLFIDHDGLHGDIPKEGSIALGEGIHKFKIIYFQAGGGKTIRLEWDNHGELSTIGPNNFLYDPEEFPDLEESKLLTTNKIPGHGTVLDKVHPSYDLSQARPSAFQPRVGGMDFLSDGRLVVSTWDPAGSVFIVDGVQSGDSTKMSVKTIAAGLAEPLGLKVVDDEIYILQKQELTKLVDLDGDDMIDEYQTVCNAWRVSANFHEFAFGLEYKEGYFYGALATAINPGGASTQPQIPDRGKVLKISKEDGSMELIAHGLRTPNGIGKGTDGELFIADNQGDWLPSSKIVHVKKGSFYGSRSVDFEGTADLTETQPVVWLPQDEIGNSPSTPLILKDGPYNGQMIHGEVTHGGIKRVFVEKVNGEYQGALFRWTQGLEAGVNRLVWGPDNALYIGGVGSTGNWSHTGKKWYGLQRMKYNGQSTFEMLAVRAKSNGVEIEFTEPFKAGDGSDPSAYEIKQWYYLPTIEYGGPKLDEKELEILSIDMSQDGKKVFLELDGMKAGHVVYINILNRPVSANGNELWSSECWYTMNNIPEGDPDS